MSFSLAPHPVGIKFWTSIWRDCIVTFGDHSNAELCVLRDGVSKLGLQEAIPSVLLQALSEHSGRHGVLDALLSVLDNPSWRDERGGRLRGRVASWDAGDCRACFAKGRYFRQRLLNCRDSCKDAGISYVSELRREWRTPHPISGERTCALSNLGVLDVIECQVAQSGSSKVSLPMWERHHAFLGAQGAGTGLHVDQAWWGNILKNYLGYKLLAIWAPEHAERVLQECNGELLRHPLSAKQLDVLKQAAKIVLLGPGDIVSFNGAMPHTTVVVGDMLNFTDTEGFINWNPNNLKLLFRGRAQHDKCWRASMADRSFSVLLSELHASIEALSKNFSDLSNYRYLDELVALIDAQRSAQKVAVENPSKTKEEKGSLRARSRSTSADSSSDSSFITSRTQNAKKRRRWTSFT
eukprot:TRINITY_DN3960_c0_g3_i2.p1 TRINITY_DN3960_c0_g3~~TRINITY_DN3960_c0_g3_i2.p1  ORF type:complete len:409 (+),score=47.23 TRINITY_DN3960_c0_g3_i2:65-1291(+)